MAEPFASEPAIDRRIARTRHALQRALMNLIIEKGYEAVTVQDVCDAANVGRSTFYAHYTGKDDLKRSGLDHLRHMLMARQAQAGGEGPLSFSVALFEHARDHLPLYRALAGSEGAAISLGVLRDTIAGLVRKDLTPTGDMPRDLAVAFVTGAFMSVLTWWLDGGAKLPPPQVDALFHRLARGGVAA